MKFFFLNVRQPSKLAAKKRLNAVISNDRVNVSQGKTIEKIRKEVAAVLSKYTPDNEAAGNISVTKVSGGECLLAEKIRLKTTQ